MSDTVIPTPSTTVVGRHRATWWDRLAIVLLGLAGCALSYDALRQMATAVHVRPTLTYVFPVVIDGFIAYGVRALLVLREAPLPARLYAWGLFIAATAASIWANSVHALDLNRPGTVSLHLGDTTVTVLSAIPPLALAGATHLHLLIKRYGGTLAGPAQAPVSATLAGVQDGPQPSPAQAVEVPYTASAGAPVEIPTLPQAPALPASVAPERTASPSADGAEPEAGHGGEDDPVDAYDDPAEDHESAGQNLRGDSGQPPVTSPGGRPALASIAGLADVIAAAHPDGSGLTRDSARKAVTDAGLGAGTERLTEAMALVRQRSEARQHPAD
ncbi:DUF2637 domain-containing protein [Streptacidiphilus jiangxiensis]|uniref:DUF2637 domain-containing protein n=1 Tax=Streptacidiphilus jiangxiensis TaxID=235985 RepID=A0A1H7IV41_STRJI|nr:DUF2637 domain-containing protein [Streptacidiphilus jiangxiensis]SEK66373.1 Protein of unknown function [Streptacidiphilus jiangxiensis]